ncbi:MAG: RNA methyltransferase [Treponema sp.]|nr:RNA methyltransferase [Treponema sp.]
MKNTQNNELAVCGLAAVKKLEKIHPECIKRLYFTEAVAPLFGGLCKKLARNRRIYNAVAAADLEKLCGTVHHQGVVAMRSLPEIVPLDSDIVAGWVMAHEHVLVLDRIGNANNFGAIIRSAAFFGMKHIVIPNDAAQSSITTSTYRIAEGGMEMVTVYSVNSIPRLLDAAAGAFFRIGTDLKSRTPVAAVRHTAHGKPYLIILGNEERGISDAIRRQCDALVIIPFAGMQESRPAPTVDSLNVAQSASVVLYELLCR